jgi:hypothetical protein
MGEAELDDLICELLHFHDEMVIEVDVPIFELRDLPGLAAAIFEDLVFDAMQSRVWQRDPRPVKHPSLRQPAA